MTVSGVRRALFLSRDPGSVRAMLPVAKVLAGPAGWSVTALGLPPTFAQVRDGLAGTPVSVEEIDAAAWQAAPADVLDTAIAHHRPHVVVSGSSPALGPPPETPEQHVIAAARRAGVPSVGILDFWGFYRERFAGPDGRIDPALIPDRLCVLDRMCRDDLVDLGLPDHRLVTTHNPALDDLVKEARLAPANRVPPDRPRLIFASQPMAENRLARGWNWDQFRLFDAVADAVPAEPRWRVTVWPHPREDGAHWRRLCRSRRGGRTDFDIDTDRSVTALTNAAAMLTSHSSAAYRAAFCDTPIISFRPFAWTRELPIVDRLELARFVGDGDSLGRILAGFDPEAERARMALLRARLGAEGVFYSDGHATERVCRVVASCASAS